MPETAQSPQDKMRETFDKATQIDAAAPVLSAALFPASGVSPDGAEGIIQIVSANGQQLRLHLDATAIEELSTMTRRMVSASRRAQRAIGQTAQHAVVINKVMIGHAHGTQGVLFVIDPESNTEVTYIIPRNEDAITYGRMLVETGSRRQKIDAAIGGAATKLMTPPKPKIIKPGMN